MFGGSNNKQAYRQRRGGRKATGCAVYHLSVSYRVCVKRVFNNNDRVVAARKHQCIRGVCVHSPPLTPHYLWLTMANLYCVYCETTMTCAALYIIARMCQICIAYGQC